MEHDSSIPKGRVAWHRRLSVRLTLLLAVTMVGFVQLLPIATRAVSRAFGLKILEPYLVESEYTAIDQGNGESMFCGVPVDAYEASVTIAELGLDGDSLSPELEVELLTGLGTWKCLEGANFALVRPDLMVLAAGLDSPAVRGQQLSLEPAREAITSYYPIQSAGKLVAWLTVFPDPDWRPRSLIFPFKTPDSDKFEQDASTLGDDPLVLSAKESESQWDQLSLIEKVVGWSLPLVAALLIGLFVSWTISRRVVRLSRRASDPSLDAFDEFTIGGGDEIAHLGKSLAASRLRIVGLLEKLESNDAQRREWFAQVSHDLRTPLTALTACLERAEPLVFKADAPAARRDLAQALQVARQDADRVQRLATDLLDVARLELPNSLVLEDLLPEEFVERAVTGLAPLAEARGIRLDFQGATMSTIVRGDGHRLLRVMENLIRNAIDHAESAVLVSVELQGEEICVSVVDDGPGFAEQGGSIRTERSGRARADSAGLGLVVVERVLAAHGSQLDLENREVRGASASFRLAAMNASGVHSQLAAS